jgi:hypothetical protein
MMMLKEVKVGVESGEFGGEAARPAAVEECREGKRAGANYAHIYFEDAERGVC